MKKKFVKGLLMAAIAVAPMSFLTSCTDHEDDRFAELQIWLSDPNNLNIKDLIAKEIGDLENRIKELEDAQKRCEQNCSTIHEELNKYLTIVQGDQRYLQIGDWNTYINSIYTKDEVDRLLDGLKQCTCDEYHQQDIINIINQYITDNKYITNSEITEIVQNFMKDYYTKNELANLLKNYITNEYLTENFYTKEEVMNIINNLPQTDLTDILNRLIALEGKDVYTKDEVNALLNGKVDKSVLDNYYDKDKVLELIKDFVNAEQVNNIIKGYGYLTREEIILLIQQYAPGGTTSGVTADWVKSYLTQYYYTITDITRLLSNYYDQATVNQMFAKIGDTSQYGNAASLQDVFIWIGTKYYDKDQIDNLIKDFITKETAIQTILDEVKNTQSELSKAIITLINTQMRTEKFITINNGDDKFTIQEAIDSLFKVKNGISCACGDMEALRQMVLAHDTLLNDTIKGQIKELYDSITTVNNFFITQINGVRDTANYAKSMAELSLKADTLLRKYCDSIYHYYAVSNDSLAERIKKLEETTANWAALVDTTKLNELADKLENLDFLTRQELLDSLTSVYKNVEEMLNDSVVKINNTIADVEKNLQDQIDDLKPQVKEIADDIKDILENIIPTLASKEWVMEQLAKQVTGVIINGAWNPVVGEGAAPIGLNLNVLAAYHGYTAGAHRFPEIDNANDATMLANSGFGRSNFVTVGPGQIYYGKDTNAPYADAGTVYVTVNPNTVDFTGQKLTMTNSQGKESGIQLDPLKKSDHKLTWGYKLTRATDNGFYEADAKLDMTQLGSVQANLDLGSLKSLASDLRNFRTQGFNVSKIISTIYEAMGDVLDRNALYAQYSDTQGVHKVYSGYDLAATSVKAFPFHHSALESYAYDRIPGLDRLEKFIDKLRGRIQSALIKVTDKALDQVDFVNDIKLYALNSEDGDQELYLELQNINILKLEVDDNTPFTFSIWDPDMNDGRGGWRTVVANATGDGSKKSYTLTMDISDLIEELYNDVAKPINDALDAVKDLIATFNSVDEKIDYYADRAENVIVKYLEKFNNRMVRYLDPNDYLTTALLVNVGDAYTRMHVSRSHPTVASSTSVKFLPTTFNAEIISPAYKKFLAITNVWNASDMTKNAVDGDAACMSALTTANAQSEIMEVVEGNRKVIAFEGQRGYVYEVLYSAIDFEGNVSNKKYYIRF